MQGLMTIELKNLQFLASHGLYPEEKKTKKEFEVNVSVSYLTGGDQINDLSQTVNYENIYEIVKKQMAQQTDLLETIAQLIADQIGSAFTGIKKIRVTIDKVNPPIPGFKGRASVTYDKEI